MRAECAGNPCGVTVRGKVSALRTVVGKKRLAVEAKPVSILLAAGQPSTLRLKFKPVDYRTLKRALAHGTKLVATISASAKSGNFGATARRHMKLVAGSSHVHR